MSLSLVTAPASEPVSTSDFKEHARITNTDEDSLVANLIVAARRWVENYTSRQLITATWRLVLDRFPLGDCEILIPLPPLQSVGSITYVDENGTSQTWAATEYVVDTASEPGRVYLGYNKSWPDTRSQRDAVTIDFDAGYGSNASDIPEDIIAALNLVGADMFENREQSIVGPTPNKVLTCAENLLMDYVQRINIPLN
jgi:uncharacterized phiE125 gp8 family phage protein